MPNARWLTYNGVIMAVLLVITAPSLSVAGGDTGPGPAGPPTCQPPSQIADQAGAVATDHITPATIGFVRIGDSIAG